MSERNDRRIATPSEELFIMLRNADKSEYFKLLQRIYELDYEDYLQWLEQNTYQATKSLERN